MEKELSDLRTEVYEARNLVIKTDNLLRTLHAEVKAVGKTQERFEKKHFVSSVAAYVLFAALAGVAAVFTGLSLSSTAREAADEAIAEAAAELEAAEAESLEAKEALKARLEAERVATAVYRQIISDSQEDQVAALEKLGAIDMSLVPEIVRERLASRAGEVRLQVVRDAWDRGRRAYLAERMEEAVADLDLVVTHGRHLAADFEPATHATATYYLGAAKNRLGAHEGAVAALRQYVSDENAPRNTLPYAYLLLGDSLVSLERIDDARQAFSTGLEIEPGGRHAQLLRRRMGGLAQLETTEAAD